MVSFVFLFRKGKRHFFLLHCSYIIVSTLNFLICTFICEKHLMTDCFLPSGKGMVLCIEKALANAGVAREDVNYINAHAASTQIGDLIEFRALIRCFGNNPEVKYYSKQWLSFLILILESSFSLCGNFC